MYQKIYLGANLLPESLEIGEPKIGATASFEELEAVFVIAFTGDKFNGQDLNKNGKTYNGIDSSINFLVTNLLSTGLAIINQAGDGDKIFAVFSIPKLAVWDFIPHDSGNVTTYYCEPLPTFKQSVINKTLRSTPDNLDGYVPRNQKLRTYPFMYLGFNPQNGNSRIYRYEDFINGTPSFDVISEINPNPQVCFIPKNYRGTVNNIEDLGSLNGYPSISYTADNFNTWLAQNSNIVSLNMEQEAKNYKIDQLQTEISGFGNIVGSSFDNNLGGTISSAVSTGFSLAKNDINHEYYVKNQMAQIEKQAMLPDKANLSSSNATLLGYNLIDNNIFSRYTIKKQFAERIDKYFDMYGYSTNELKIPNIKNRPNWNYIKLIGSNIIANIPQIDLQQIKNMFDNGITLWHNTNTFLDYSQNNR